VRGNYPVSPLAGLEPSVQQPEGMTVLPTHHRTTGDSKAYAIDRLHTNTAPLTILVLGALGSYMIDLFYRNF